MELPNLTKRDLICLLSATETAVQKAIGILRLHLKPNLTDDELVMLRIIVTSLRVAFKRNYMSANRNMSSFKEKYAAWLETGVRVPDCLIKNWPNRFSAAARKCANCQKNLKKKSTVAANRSSTETLEAFQIVFEGLLKFNNVTLLNTLPEICSDCESLLMSLHTQYVEFMSLTETSSPIHVLLGDSAVWNGESEPNPIVTTARLSAKSRNKRKHLDPIQGGRIKTRKSRKNQGGQNHQEHYSDSKAKPKLAIAVDISPPTAADDGDVELKSTQTGVSVKRTLGYGCPHCSTISMGQAAFNQHMKTHKVRKSPYAHNRTPIKETIASSPISLNKLDASSTVTVGSTESGTSPTAIRDIVQNETDDNDTEGNTESDTPLNTSVEDMISKNCPHCCKIIDGKRALELHLLSHKIVLLRCPHCTSHFRGNDCLQLHIRSVHSAGNSADELVPAGTSKNAGKSKSGKPRSKLVSQRIECHVCEQKVKMSYMNTHLKIHEPERKNEWVCELCGKAYRAKCHLVRHVKLIHMESKEHICSHCGLGFGEPYCLKIHLLSKHEANTGPGYPCTICGKVFKFKNYLYQHLISKVHGGPGLYRSKLRTKQIEATQQE